jgi:hypothetical protein
MVEPSFRCGRIRAGMVQGRHQVGFADTALAYQYDRSVLVRTDRLQCLYEIVARIGNLKKLLRGDLSRTGFALGREFNGGPLEGSSSKFGPKGKV